MALILQVMVLAGLSLQVQANNATLVHGWTPGPVGRGTWSITWSCLATIIICTWSALHLDVPNRQTPGLYLLFRKVRWMCLAVLAPELILFNGASNFLWAKVVLRYCSRYGNEDWTLTHAQFGIAGGFRMSTDGSDSTHNAYEFMRLLEQEDVGKPPIGVEELQARGRSDGIIKLIAILQILWFVIQTIFRAVQHYHTTALEVMTVAFVFCSIFIYGFNFNRPQNVDYPVPFEVFPHTKEHTRAKVMEPFRSSVESDVARTEIRRGIVPIRPRFSLKTVRTGMSMQEIRGSFKEIRGRMAERLPAFLFGIFACGFGGLHCLAWNSSFPTPAEQLAWRICAAVTTALPAFFALVLSADGEFGNDRKQLRLSVRYAFPTGVYVMGRITIVVLAFMELRAVPANAFLTVDWSHYIPHFVS